MFNEKMTVKEIIKMVILIAFGWMFLATITLATLFFAEWAYKVTH